jgi:energy-coupling factor transporter ATP-binding protein EcfA2/DNA-binding MarR family transcriptional regulator
MDNIISKTPLIDLSDNKDLEKSVLDIFSEDSSKLTFKHYGYSSNPFFRPDKWPDNSDYKKLFGTDLFIQNVFEKDFLREFVNAITENKYFLIRGPSGIGKSTISELFYSLLSTSKDFASNIKNQLGIENYYTLKLNFETENWKYETNERLDRIKNQLDGIRPSEKFDATFLIIDNIAEISDCWTEITDLFNEYFGYFFIVGTIKISEYLFLDYYRKKSLNEKANTVDRFIEAFSIVKDVPLWPVLKIRELLEKRVKLSSNPESFKIDPEVFREIAGLSSGVPQIGLGLFDRLFSLAFENDKISSFTLEVAQNLLTFDYINKLREFNLISRASEPGAEAPQSIKKLYNDLTKDTRKTIITSLISAYGGVKLRIGKYPSLNIDTHLKKIAKNAIKDLPMIPSRLSEEVAKGASTITYHLDWLENQGLVTRSMQDEKEKIVLLKESSIELFEILSTSFNRT